MSARDVPENGVTRFKPYPEYKVSGVEWLGEIPAHWEAVPIRSLARPGFKTFTDGDWIESPFIREEGVRLIQTGNVGVGEYREQGFRYVDEETFRAFRCTEVLPGDVLICRLADPVGRACLAPDLACRMITSVDVCILKTSPTVDAGYVVFTLSGSGYLSWMSGICRGGTRDRVSRSMLGSIRVQKPPYEEQRAIAAFLDRETVKIDALVAKKERLIELLQEKRTALITRAVSEGVLNHCPWDGQAGGNPGSMNHLGSWQFPLPSGWKRERLKFNTYMKGRLGWQNLRSDEYTDEGPCLVASEQFADDTVDWVRCHHVTRERYEMDREIELREHDVLFMKDGAAMGKLAYIDYLPTEACLSSHLLLLRPLGGAYLPRFLYYVFKTPFFESYIIEERVGTTFFGFTQESMGNFSISLPPPSVQKEIVEYLDSETEKVDCLVRKVREGINGLKEYRTALISAAVTGKIDAREEAI